MSKIIIFMRHGKAADIANFRNDFDRPLVKRGIAEVTIAALKLLNAKLFPDIILASPAVRTQDTAHAAFEVLKTGKNKIITVDELYEGNTADYLAAINNCKYECVLIIGHNPYIGSLSMTFSKHKIFSFPTSAIAAFKFDHLHIDMDNDAEMIYCDLRK